MSMILVTGGAGYIGSVAVQILRENNFNVIVIDDLSRGNRASLPEDVTFYHGNIGDKQLLKQIICKHQIDICLHFAAYAYVGESVNQPQLYFNNNVVNSIGLLDTLIKEKVQKFIFSSTCAIYGDPIELPIKENHPLSPVNPYGWTKFFLEKILESYATAYDFKYVSLRYFNVGGATSQCGEYHQPETHIIPNILNVANGEKPFITINGNNHNTDDGTAIRDYIHVYDIANAYIKAIHYLENNNTSIAINLGNQKGYSILEVINMCEKLTGKQVNIKFGDKLKGDPSSLVADPNKAKEVLGWSPKYTLFDIIESAWRWKLQNPHGYNLDI